MVEIFAAFRMAGTEDVVEIEIMDAEYEYKLEPGFSCTECQLDFDAPEDFAEHLEKKHDSESLEKVMKFEDLECPECKFIFTRKNNLWRHVRKFHKHLSPPLKVISQEGCHGCPVCDRKFTRKSNLLRHIRRFHDYMVSTLLNQTPKLYTCPQCNTGFTKWNNCKRHVKHFHESVDPDQLRKANFKILMTEPETNSDDEGTTLDEDGIIIEDSLTLLPCANCDLVFTSVDELQQHFEFCLSSMESETYEKKTCPLCSFYDSKLNMYLHFTNAHDSPIVIEYLDFDSIEEFTKWRRRTEEENCTRFVELVEERQTDDARRTFVCALSKESAMKCEHGGFCPAEITLCATPDKCSVLFVKTHIGHETTKMNGSEEKAS